MLTEGSNVGALRLLIVIVVSVVVDLWRDTYRWWLDEAQH
jgi:hypothetical protein